MKISNKVHQIRIHFQVTEEVQRYVYVYLITGKNCYLIDSGIAGCEKIVAEYMQRLGRSIEEIKAVFLTHAHPDHIGGAAAIQKLSGCRIYASDMEKEWIENIEMQFKERPIPNFYTLVKESVKVDEVVKEADIILPEEEITIKVLETPGHSHGSVSYIYEEEHVIFTGDAIPDIEDFPIFVDEEMSEASLEKMQSLEDIHYCCPAWDWVYQKDEWKEVLQNARMYLQKLKNSVLQIEREYGADSAENRLELLGVLMGWKHVAGNPLFRRSIAACRQENFLK